MLYPQSLNLWRSSFWYESLQDEPATIPLEARRDTASVWECLQLGSVWPVMSAPAHTSSISATSSHILHYSSAVLAVELPVAYIAMKSSKLSLSLPLSLSVLAADNAVKNVPNTITTKLTIRSSVHYHLNSNISYTFNTFSLISQDLFSIEIEYHEKNASRFS